MLVFWVVWLIFFRVLTNPLIICHMSIQHIRTLIESCLNIMNMYMGQPWNPPSAPLWSTGSWKSLKLRTSTLPPIHQGCCSGKGIILLSSKGRTHHQVLQHINSTYPYIQFTQETPMQMVAFLFGHFSFTRPRQHFSHNSLQNTYPHRTVPT